MDSDAEDYWRAGIALGVAVPLVISLVAAMPANTWWIGARLVGIARILAAIGHGGTYGIVRRSRWTYTLATR